MYKLLSINFLLILVFFSFSINAQQNNGFGVRGPNPAWEGSTESYMFYYNGNSAVPTNANFQFTVINGEIISAQSQPTEQGSITVVVKWNCLVSNGKITLQETTSQLSYTYNVLINTYETYGDLCNETTPNSQNLSYGQIPDVITVSNCSPFCEASYNFIYQWQKATLGEDILFGSTIPEAFWQNITQNGNSINYQPPALTAYNIVVYRRITSFYSPSYPGGPAVELVVKKSRPAYLYFTTRLDPGSIGTTTSYYTTYNNIPSIYSSPATGGLCLSDDYQYTWQTTDATGNWLDIGNTEQCPVNLDPISFTKYFRRKVVCGTQTLFSNTIKIIFNYISPNAEPLNYVREVTVTIPNIKTYNEVEGQLKIGEKFQTTTYYDGLGRPIQKVDIQVATPNTASNNLWGDLVQHFEYNDLGIMSKNYLPYSTISDYGNFKNNAITATGGQQEYYANKHPEDPSYAYALTTFEKSPLNRSINYKLPGENWANSTGISNDFDVPFNEANEVIPNITIGPLSSDGPKFVTNYGKRTLIKKTAIDEKRNKTIEYYNKSGKIILRKVQLNDQAVATDYTGWINTYYVYDEMDAIRYTFEPEAVKYFVENNWDFSTTEAVAVFNELCFQYAYDNLGRLIYKKTPGVGATQLAYDNRNRVVFTQDANQKFKRTFLFNLYDEQDRLQNTVLYKNSNASITSLQSILNRNDALDIQQVFQTDLNNLTISDYLKYIYYDDYTYTGVIQFSNQFNNYQAYPVSTDGLLPIARSSRTTGYITGYKVKVLDNTNTYLSTSNYYDDRGSIIQSLAQNIKGGTDVTTNQYHWDDRLMSTEVSHKVPLANNSYQLSIISKFSFDKIGRVNLVEKKVATNPFKKIVSYEYDDMGKVSVEHIDPDYTGSDGLPDIETLNYSYNLHSKLTGINKHYALKTPGLYDKYGNANGKFFGMYLKYDRDEASVFNNNPLLNGQISGQLWSTLGDDAQRKYEYTYDNLGRLSKADFTERQQATEAFSNNTMDFSVGGNAETNGKIEYDLNGNLLRMSQKGILVGQLGTFNIDNLIYKYQPIAAGSNYTSNKLSSIKDATNNPYNGTLLDFKDGENITEDYVYDDNGNAIVDLNKKIEKVVGGVNTPIGVSGILYNYLDKPELINIAGKGTVAILYDADGTKLQRTFNPLNTSQSGNTITYIGEFIYHETTNNPASIKLQSIELGTCRIRMMTNVATSNVFNGITYDWLNIQSSIIMPNNDAGVYDFYIKDNLQNVRMILTEQLHEGQSTCTMEKGSNREFTESSIWSNPNSNGNTDNLINFRINAIDIPGSTPTQSIWADPTIEKSVCKLDGSFGKKVGPSHLAKVMGGDQISASCIYFYNQIPNNQPQQSNLFNALVAPLVQALTGGPLAAASSKTAESIGNIQNSIGGNPIFNNITAPDQNTADQIPRAYLTILFFDERFNFIEEGSQSIRVGGPDNNPNPYPMVFQDIKAPKNGYVYVYVSNESNTPVYFDNVQVKHTRGRIIEENHYYPFGLKIASLSAKKLTNDNEGVVKNNYLYQGEFSEYDDDLGWNDFELRSYDPQIGRFVNADPYDQFSSPYIGMGNDPANNIDEDGGWSAGLTGMVIGAVVGFSAPYIYERITGNEVKNKGLWGLAGAFVGAGVGYGIGESLSNRNDGDGTRSIDGGFNGSTNFWANFKQFYSGLFGVNSTSWHSGKNGYAYATTPDLWGWIPKYEWVISEILTLKGSVIINSTTSNTGEANVSSSNTQTNSAHVTLDNPKYKKIRFEPEGKSVKNITILKNNKIVFKGRLLKDNKKIWRNRFMGSANNFEIQQTIEHTDRAPANGHTLQEVKVSTWPRIFVKMKMRVN